MRYLVFLCFLVFVSCDKGSEEAIDEVLETEVIETEISLPLASSFEEIDLSQGTRSSTIELSNGAPLDFVISVPQEIGSDTVALIMCLHGGSGSTHPIEYMKCLPVRAFSDKKVILLGPRGGRWGLEEDEARILKLVEFAKIYWPIDPKKIVVTGYSQGGLGSMFFATHHPETFTAAIPMATNFSEACPVIPVYVINGANDTFHDIGEVRQNAQRCGAFLKAMEGLSHYDACHFEMVLTLRDTWNWLEEVWGTNE